MTAAWPVGWDGHEAVGAPWPLGELEVAVYLRAEGLQRPAEEDEEAGGEEAAGGEDARAQAMLPITGRLRRALLRRGLQRERLTRLMEGKSRVRELVRGIEGGTLRVLASKEQRSWGKYDHDVEGVGHVVGHLLETGRDVAGKRSRRGRGEVEAMWATAPYAVGRCVWCAEKSGHEHAVRCSEWRPEVRQAEVRAAEAIAPRCSPLSADPVEKPPFGTSFL